MVTPEDIAEEIRNSLPGTEEIVVQYLAGYLLDDAGEDEDILQIARLILESVAGRNTSILETLMEKLTDMLNDLLSARASQKSRGTGLTKLDRAMEIGKTAAMSGTIAMSQGVDLESINKGK
jgi:ATP-binding cassette, subfamily F, member 3